MQTLKKLSVFAVCLMIGLSASLFMACGKDDNTIRLNEVTHSIFYAPLYVAQNMGFFEEEGIKLELESASGSNTSMNALLSGSADIILAGPETVVYSEEVKDHPVVFGQLTQRDGSFIVSSEEIEGEFNIDMLKGKSIVGGREGGLPAMTLQYVIEELAGLTIGENKVAGEVNLVYCDFAMIGSIYETSKAEFCTLFEPTATNMVKKGSGHIVSSVGAVSDSIPYTCFATSSSYLKNHADKAEAFLRAVQKGYDYIEKENSLTVAKALEKSFIGMSVEELQVAVEQYRSINAWCSSPVMEESSFNMLVNIINHYKGTDTKPDFSKLVDNSIAEKVAKKTA